MFFNEPVVRIRVSSGVATKTGVSREVFITEEAAKVLKEYLGDKD